MSDGAPMIDSFGRRIEYLRISVTDRCDLRCRYCMSEKMTFLPRSEVLSLEEIAIIADRFIARGVRKIRLSGGEPLVRRDFPDLVHRIARHLGHGLDELTLTTNGTRLGDFADDLAAAGMRRINVSLDSRDPETFAFVTRGGSIDRTLEGVAAARAAGLRIKINMVALRGVNDAEIVPMLRWCAEHGHDLTLIETMPLGETGEDRTDRYLPLGEAVATIEREYRLRPVTYRSGGPARYFEAEGLPGVLLGLITPLSNNFCAGCNRMRLTCEGKIYMCLGHEDHVDLKAAYREGGVAAVDAMLDRALIAKPLAHDFAIGVGAGETRGPQKRHMSVTGG